MKFPLKLSSLLFCCFICACNQARKSDYLVIDLTNNHQLPIEKIALSEISETIQIIPLETSDSVLIGRISGIKMEADRLYVRASNGVFVFDSNGKFLNTVGSKGRGPREYVYLYDLFPENNMVWLIDASGKKVLKFTDAGRFVESFELEKQIFTEFYHTGDDTFIGFVPDFCQPNTDIMLAFFNKMGMVDSILYRNPIKEGNTMVRFYVAEVNFINHGKRLKFKHLFNDTIYSIKNNKLTPEIALHLGARKANENARAEAAVQSPGAVDIFKDMDRAWLLGENDRYIYLKVEDNPFFYDKKEQKVHKWTLSLPEDKRIDLEQSIKFNPLYIDKNGHLIGETSPANAEDNPVIVVAKLKR